MKSFFACLSIALFVFSGIRAPEAHDVSRGICLSGAVLEKAADISHETQAFRKAATNPLLIHSGFAPSAHLFDFPALPYLPKPVISDTLISRNASDLGSNVVFPHDRPSIVFFS